MASGPESRLHKRIRKGLQQAFPNIFIVKTHGGPFQAAGLPDLVGCYWGRFIGFEVKLPKKAHTLTALQANTLNELQRASAVAEMICWPEEAIDIVDEAIKGVYEPVPYTQNKKGHYTRGGI